MGDVNTTLIHTAKGRTILLQYDVTTPRPVSYTHLDVYKRQEIDADKANEYISHLDGVKAFAGGSKADEAWVHFCEQSFEVLFFMVSSPE